MYINLNNLLYSAGDSLSGNLHIKLEKAVNTDSIYLRFSGKESISHSGSISEYPILSYSILLYKWPNASASAGDYVFPFEIYLPTNLPSTTSLHLSSTTASIEYLLEALMPPITQDSSVITIKSFQNFPQSLNTSEASLDIKLLCIKRSTVELKASVKKYSYISTDIIKLSIEGYCEYMPSVRVEFIRSFMGRTSEGKFEMIKTQLIEFETNEEIIDIDLKRFEDRLLTQCSSKGQAISCTYSIAVTGMVNAVCNREVIEVLLWVVINPQAKPRGLPKYSSAWRPIYMNGVKYVDNSNSLEVN